MQSKIQTYINSFLPFFLGIGIYVLLYISSNFEKEEFSFFIPIFFIVESALVIWMVRAYLNSWIKKPHHSTLNLTAFVVALIMAVSTYVIAYIALKGLLIVLTSQNDSISIRHLTLSVVQSTFMSLIIVGAQFLIIGTRIWSEKQLQTEKLLKKNMEARLQNLKMQLSPHFLFNSFNTLEGLIHLDPKAASDFLLELSSLYRMILKHGEETIILLADEIKMVEHFIKLIKTRFGNSFHLEVNIPQEAQNHNYVAPLALQLLVENVLKHNAIGPGKILRCEISLSSKYIVISNNIILKIDETNSPKMGLQNLKERYHYLSDLPIQIEDNGENFMVAVPLLDIEVFESSEISEI